MQLHLGLNSLTGQVVAVLYKRESPCTVCVCVCVSFSVSTAKYYAACLCVAVVFYAVRRRAGFRHGRSGGRAGGPRAFQTATTKDVESPPPKQPSKDEVAQPKVQRQVSPPQVEPSPPQTAPHPHSQLTAD